MYPSLSRIQGYFGETRHRQAKAGKNNKKIDKLKNFQYIIINDNGRIETNYDRAANEAVVCDEGHEKDVSKCFPTAIQYSL